MRTESPHAYQPRAIALENRPNKPIHPPCKGALAFYRARRGKGEKAIDISTFFRRRGLPIEFEKFWAHHTGGHRQQFKRALARFRRSILQKAFRGEMVSDPSKGQGS